jgi:hypothetical protein
MRACGALAGAQRARVAPRRPRGHDGRMFTAVKLLVTSEAYKGARGPRAGHSFCAARAARTVLRGASRGFAAVLVARLRRGVGGPASPRCWWRGFAAVLVTRLRR